MGYSMVTKSGYNFYDISSLLQKAIRRGDLDKAGFALKELLPKYPQYVWKRLLTISAEDCYGIMTKEIMALEQADEWMKKHNKGGQESIYAAKACVLLCLARKNRDACYVACNFMDENRNLDPNEIKDYISFEDGDYDGTIPEYAFDCHTRTGKRRGKDILDMIKTEGDALEPHQMSLFDYGDWGPYLELEKSWGNLNRPGDDERIRKFQEGKETDPTHGGERWPDIKENWGSRER